jgi:phosphoribosylaminoimidazole (AIR) synthetase
MGVGIAAVVKSNFVTQAISHLKEKGVEAYEIGSIKKGKKTVRFIGTLKWA